MTQPNLELIINNDKWKVLITKETTGSYWRVNTQEKTLIINNYDVDRAKYQCWLTYKR